MHRKRNGEKHDHYRVLGVGRDATEAEIRRAYRRHMSESSSEHTAPDPRLDALVQEAYEALTDPERREAYDRTLAPPKLLGISGGDNPRKRWTVAIGGLLLVLGGAYYFLVAREREAAMGLYPATEGAMQVHTAASVAIGRVTRIDISGKATPLGIAVAVEEGVMMTPCTGLAPGAQIVVSIPPRSVPGALLAADEASGLCKLRMHAGGSWPLMLTAQEPRPNDRIYAVQVNPQGEVVLREAKVVRVSHGPKGRVVEVAKHLAQVPEGSPLMDLHGRIFAVAMEGQHRMLPAGWGEGTQPGAVPRTAAPPPQEDDEPDAKPAPGPPRGFRPEDISPERRERLEKAFRPPPSVPDDL
jgi:hypothetical protein